MTGHLLLAGGGEFRGIMLNPDLRAIELAGGGNIPISVLPTAAAPDRRYQIVGAQAVHWFRSLGAEHVQVLPIADKQSANDPWMAHYLRRSRLIYLTDGFVRYLHQTLQGSSCLDALLDAYCSGALIAGSGAGAMLLCQYFFDPVSREIGEGLGLLPNTCVLPHHNLFGCGWVEQITDSLPDVVVVGIDERTAMIDDGEDGKKLHWNVYGQGTVSLYRQATPIRYNVGQRLIDSFTKF
jgi:cyanophycinase